MTWAQEGLSRDVPGRLPIDQNVHEGDVITWAHFPHTGPLLGESFPPYYSISIIDEILTVSLMGILIWRIHHAVFFQMDFKFAEIFLRQGLAQLRSWAPQLINLRIMSRNEILTFLKYFPDISFKFLTITSSVRCLVTFFRTVIAQGINMIVTWILICFEQSDICMIFLKPI